MPRQARVVVPGLPHHIIQRGNRRQDVFFTAEDRQVYLRNLQSATTRWGVKIWAWCLMTNHVHCVAVPERPEALAQCFADVHRQYTWRINRRHGWTGHLWQTRFSSSVMDEPYLLAAVRYIERNPVEARMVQEPWTYSWSSAAYHVGSVRYDPVIRGDEFLRGRIQNWKQFLSKPQPATERSALEHATMQCRPLGSAAFLTQLEERTGLRLHPRPRGRPKLLK